MTEAAPAPLTLRPRSNQPPVWLSLGLGLAASLLIFGGLSLAQRKSAGEPPPAMDDLRAVVLPVLPPPPPVDTEDLRLPQAANFIQLEESRAPDSPVKLPAMPLITTDLPPPTVTPRFDFSSSAFQAVSLDSEFNSRHVFNISEVDQRPMALVKIRPDVSPRLVRLAENPRNSFLFVVNADGTLDSFRQLTSTGCKPIDRACADAIRQWKFSPAVRRGKKVRCWVQQAFTFRLEEGSPFETH